MTRHVILLTIVFTLTIGANAQPKKPAILTTATPEEGGFSTTRLARLDTAMSNWVKNKYINGSVALIARRGKIVFYKSYGYNDLDTKAPLPKTGIFRIASQTKAVTTVAALMLWEQGKFSMDDLVSKYIPSFRNPQVLATFNPKDSSYTTVPAKRPITIHDLFTHTSGLGYPAIGTPEANAIYAKNAMTGGVGVKGQTLADAMNRLGSLPLLYQPGEKWMYGLSTDVLGYLIQLWSGENLEEYFANHIFRPLGMHDTYFNLPAEKAPRLVNFFQEDSTGIKKQTAVFGGALDMNFPLQKTGYFSGGGGLSSTIYDYAILLQMLLNGGEYNGVRLLGPNTVRMMTMNQIGDLTVNVGEGAGSNKWGLTFSIETEQGSRFTPSQAGSYGWGGVFGTSYWVDPKEDMFVIFYRQMWGPHVGIPAMQFKPLVYQATND